MRARIAAGVGVAVLAGLALLGSVWRAPGTDAAREPVTVAAAPGARATPALSVSRVESESLAAAAPADGPEALGSLRARLARSSLRGAQPDGAFRLDAAGGLRVDAALRRRFDWYLSLLGEFTVEEIRALVLGDASDAHGPGLAADVSHWFDRYLGLRSDLAASGPAADLGERLAQLRAARRDWFGEHATALFGAEEADIEHSLAVMALHDDASLEPGDRDARLAALQAARPPARRRGEADATSPQLVAEQTRQFDQLGLDRAARHAERAALWGEAAATRLEALDRERAQWERRLDDYERERRRLMSDPRLDSAARQRALLALRETRFSASERQRVEALEAVGALRRGG